ncbi:putative acetyltransferase EpsM [compost metagenome]
MSAERTLLILGAGGHGKAVAEAALLSGEWQRVLFADDRWPLLTESFGMPVVGNLGCLERLSDKVDAGIAAVGNNELRENWQTALVAAQIPLAYVVHPRAWVSPSADVGPGTAVMALAVVGTNARLGRGVIVNAGSVVDHDAEVGDFGHLGVGVSLAGGVRVESAAWLQAGCSAGYGVVVESAAVLGPGTALSAKD